MAVVNPAFPPIREGQFAGRIDATLMVGSRPFRFHGNNTYYLQAEMAYGRVFTVEETLDKMAELGLSVARANAHNDHPPAQDPAAIQTAPGVYVESSLVALDGAVAEARKRNIRLILKLTNNWEAYGGIRRYVGWLLGRAPTAAEYSLFYTDPTIRQWFQNYIRTIVERRNTITGVLYRDEPAILAWELGNELRNPAPGASAALIDWTAEMARFLKSVDPNHLVADGGEGFDDDASLYPGLSSSYAVAGREGASFHRVVAIPEIDMASYHMYPASWGLNDTTDAAIWIRRHEEIARAAGKIAYLGEYGKRAGDQAPPGCSPAPGRAYDAERARIFSTWLAEAAIREGSAGYMAWQLIDDGRNDCEGFQIYHPRDGATSAVLREFAGVAGAAPVATSGASFAPVRLAPDSFASLFGDGLAEREEAAQALPLPVELGGARVMVVDSRGAAREAALTYAGRSQINFVVPPETAEGAAIARVMRVGAVRATATLSIRRVAPALFSADASGTGLAAAIVTAAGTERIVSLYGTGWRGAAASTEVTIGGAVAEVLYSGAQSEYPALDQINARIPAGLSGEVEVRVVAGGQAANVVRLDLR